MPSFSIIPNTGTLLYAPLSRFPLRSSAQICLFQFYLTIEKFLKIFNISNNSDHYKGYSFKNSRIAQSHLLRYFSSQHLKFKQLYDPKPLFKRYIKLINPSAGKVIKLITTPFTAVSFIPYTVNFVAPARCAKIWRFFQQFFLL